ncbi:catalase family protein [Marininema halotolerans]|uniref:Catalase n=1 Tax=Marininema halotolerans TaxID=1155944 RepID=A0A1I6RDX5_9BACL|nr:catalase family protein [Marininema halotolerans]SFS62902.1 Catalase [Marininema halotolerans]
MTRITRFEKVDKKETQYINEMDTLLKKQIAKYPVGHTLRDAHPKHLGLLQGQFTIREDLPPELQVGIFQPGQTYPVWVRISNASGRVQTDDKKDIRGFAIKLMGIDGEKYQSDESTTQDFVLLSTPTIPFGTVKLFRDAIYYTLKYSPLLFLLRMIFQGNLTKVQELNHARQNHSSPFDIRFWSTTPYLFGRDQVVKYSLRPTSSYQSQLPDTLTKTYLRENMERHLSKTDARFDFMIQFSNDPQTMPVEDAAIHWCEESSPFIKVATLTIPQQSFRTTERDNLAEEFSFSPGHALIEHQPIGGLNRARTEIYQRISRFRHERDQRDQTEPTPQDFF